MTDHTEDLVDDGDPRIAAGYERVQRYWDLIGPSDADVLTYLVNPQFNGKPAWPNMRQAYRVVRPEGSLILASDGLSDPFVRSSITDRQGYGCEVYIEAPDFARADFATLRGSWAFKLVENFAMNVADWGGLSEKIATQGVLSVEFPMTDVLPSKWLTADGSAGFLVNLPVSGRTPQISDMPFGPIDIVPLTLIRPSELEALRAGGSQARVALAATYTARSDAHVSRL